jgi:hypothetical protein
MVYKEALGPFISEYFSFPCQLSFHQPLHINLSFHHRRYVVSMLATLLQTHNLDEIRTGHLPDASQRHYLLS